MSFSAEYPMVVWVTGYGETEIEASINAKKQAEVVSCQLRRGPHNISQCDLGPILQVKVTPSWEE